METAPLMLALVALAGSPAAAGNTGELKIELARDHGVIP